MGLRARRQSGFKQNSSGNLRILAIATAVWSVVIFAAILIIPSFINWSEQKGKFSEFVQIATGYRLKIGGELDLRMIPRPRVEAADITLLDGRGNSVARIDHASAKVRLWPLFFGRVQVTDLVLENPELNFSATDILLAGNSSRSGDVGLRHITVLNGRIRPENVLPADAVEPPETLSGFPHIEMVFDPERQALSIAGDALIRGVPVKLDIVRGPFAPGEDGATAPLNASLRWYQSGATGRFRGRLREGGPQSGTPPAIIGRASLTGSDWPGFLVEIGSTGALPQSSLAFLISSQIEPAQDGVRLTDLTVNLSGEQLSGSGMLGFAPTPSLAIALKGRRFSLDQVAAGLPIGLDIPPPPDWLDISVKASSRRVEWLDGHLRNAELDLAIDQGKVMLNAFKSKLPGSSTLQITGVATREPSGWVFGGNGHLASLSLSQLAEWSSLIPASLQRAVDTRALRRLQAVFSLAVSEGRISFTDLKATLGDTSFAGQLTVQPSGSPTASLTGRIDRLDLPDPQILRGYLKQPGLMSALDLQANVSLGAAVFPGFTAQDVATQLTVKDSQLVLDPLSIADLAGTAVKGKLVLTPGTNKIFQNFEGSVVSDDGHGFAGLLGLADWWPGRTSIPLEGDILSSQSAEGQQLIFSGLLGSGPAALQLSTDPNGNQSVSFEGNDIDPDITARLLENGPLHAVRSFAARLASRHIDGTLSREGDRSVLILNMGDKDLLVHTELSQNLQDKEPSLRGAYSLISRSPRTIYPSLPGQCPLEMRGDLHLTNDRLTLAPGELGCGPHKMGISGEIQSTKFKPSLALTLTDIDLEQLSPAAWTGWKNLLTALDRDFTSTQLQAKMDYATGPLPFKVLGLTANLKNGGLQFNLGNPNQLETWGLVGTLLLAGPIPRIDVDLSAHQLASKHLGALMSGPAVAMIQNTLLTASGHLVLSGLDPAAWRSGASATIDLTLEGGTVNPMALPPAFRPDEADASVPLTSASGTVRISGADIRVQDFVARFAEDSLHLTGQVAGRKSGTGALAKFTGADGKSRFYRVFDFLTRPVWEDFVLAAAPAPSE